MIIHNETIQPGQSKSIRIHVGKLPSGHVVSIKTHVFRAEEPGPIILLLAGLHGDEINGVEILRRVLHYKLCDNLIRGTVVVIPLLNVYGFINFSRDVTDGKDVNRSFPGSYRGSLASRIANLLSKTILPHIDFGIDFHTGGADRYNYPQIRFTKNDDFANELSLVFNAPFSIVKGTIKGSLRSQARKMQKTMLVYEGGESLRLDGYSIDMALSGIKNILVHLNMIDETRTPRQRPSIFVTKTTWIRAKQSGIFIWSKSSGHSIRKDEILGSIYDPNGDKRIVVKANRDGFIIGHNNKPVVHQGEALFHIAYV